MASDAASLQALVDPTCERPWWSGQNFTFGCKFRPEPILIVVVISGFAAEHDGHIVLLPRIICHVFYRREFKGVVFFTMTVVARPATKISDSKVTRISPCGGSPTYGKARTAFSPTNFWSSNTCQTTKANATLSASPKSGSSAFTPVPNTANPPQKRRRQLSIFSFLHSPFFVFIGGIVG